MRGKTDKGGARSGALRVLKRVYGGGAWADIVLAGELEGLPEGARAFTTELVYGVLRNQARLDWIINAFSNIKTKKLEHDVLYALRLGVYQLTDIVNIPGPVAINETVGLVRGAGPAGRKRAGFVNAVLRKVSTGLEGVRYPDLATDPVAHISVVYSHPEWLVKRWVERYGPDFTRELAEANTRVPPRTLRVNTLKASEEGLLRELEAEGVTAHKAVFSPEGITVSGRVKALDPRYYIQDEASQLVAHLAGPRPGEKVLDASAAPGGKTTHMAALMKNRGLVLAMDLHPERLKAVAASAKRLGADIIKIVGADAGGVLPVLPASGGFDAVLLDAPCTGLGVLRRSPDIKLNRSEADIAGLAALQGRLIGNLAAHVRPGGRLVYSVCTFEPEETDGVVERFLADNPGFTLQDAKGFLPGAAAGLVDKKGFLRCFPHRDGLDGFFAARLKRA